MPGTYMGPLHSGVTVTQRWPPSLGLSGWLLRRVEGRGAEGAGREEAGSFARLGAGMAD